MILNMDIWGGDEQMPTRFNLMKVNEEAFNVLMTMDQVAKRSTIEQGLLELIKIRASQINGCAFCIDLHTKDARRLGETERRIYALNAWRGSGFFTEREMVVLAFTEAMTLIHENQISDDLYTELEKHFTEKEISTLVLAIVSINSFNRAMIAARAFPAQEE